MLHKVPRRGSRAGKEVEASEGNPKDHLFNQCDSFSLFSLLQSVKGSYEEGILSFKERVGGCSLQGRQTHF